jgi:hypothetical protein
MAHAIRSRDIRLRLAIGKALERFLALIGAQLSWPSKFHATGLRRLPGCAIAFIPRTRPRSGDSICSKKKLD